VLLLKITSISNIETHTLSHSRSHYVGLNREKHHFPLRSQCWVTRSSTWGLRLLQLIFKFSPFVLCVFSYLLIFFFFVTIPSTQSSNCWSRSIIGRSRSRSESIRKQNIEQKYFAQSALNNKVYGFMVLNATFNNISVISWRSVLLVARETRVSRENHWSVTSLWQTLSHMFYRVHLAWVGIEPTTSVVIGTDCIGS
jgi:hypothetical protein